MFQVDRDGGVAVLEVAHGKVNAVDLELAEGLTGAIGDLAGSDAEAVVLIGAGRAFSAGVDLYRLLDGGKEYAERFLPALSALFDAFFGFPKPLVTAVNGAAVAGGCVLACCGDRRLIADGARIGVPELRVGVPFPVSPLEIVRYACGRDAEEVIYSGRLYQGAEAVGVGIANEAVAAEELRDRAVAAAADLAAVAAEPFRLAKEQLRRPTVDRIRADGPAVDGLATAIWGSAETAATVRDYLDRTVGKG
ncbi:MAG TPA: enoyl-CoA hydratase/isomerase family protein [Acidimicrobiales bacterium]|nr:enoyl-CoA hydratase/isomerase family protein [Acidimicrobiales bacterium]